MLFYVIRRFIYMLIILAVMSVTAFLIIQLPPGDYVEMYIHQLEISGQTVDEAEIASLRRQYGLDLPVYLRYFKWVWGILHGDFGRSLQWGKPVSELIGERLLLTVVVNLFTVIFTYAVAIPIGIYSATHQYSVGDYAFTVIGFAGLATPNFLFALVLMVLFYKYFGLSVGGLFSPEYTTAPWSIAKFVDMLKHLPIPIIVIGTAGTAGLIRVMRGCLLDELRKQYVITARAKGVSERVLLFKYPVRVAVNPIFSTIGWMLPSIVSGGTITAIVLSLPTIGPLLYRALMSEDMYLAGSMVLLLSLLTIVGTFISDLLLLWIDPRIRYEKGG
ncbi:ABC transporter permease [Candidatus Aerophobetes bacterium]|uniref:ABC transporter permease n=1 Tax=Aerophobetes bacterium TaxID=2030807 RepID=A0A497E5I1_UNCAE|nr:MAG: ABC transporter permease [Candidatus Aerophobetes bacterium]